MTNIIKTIVPTVCPCCKGDILVEFTNNSPEISSVFTLEDARTAKDDAISRVGFLSIDEDKKNQVIKWINDENTVFGPSEVSEIINSLLK